MLLHQPSNGHTNESHGEIGYKDSIAKRRPSVSENGTHIKNDTIISF